VAIRGILFDYFGTLCIYGDMAAAWADWLAAFHRNLSAHGLEMSLDDFSSRCNGFFEREEPADNGKRLSIFELRVLRLMLELGLNEDLDAVRETATAAVNAWQKHVPFDDEAPAVLGQLRKTKRLGLVSNFDHPPHLYGLLEKARLSELFEAVVISGEVGIKKPDPRIFSVALHKMGLKSPEILYVGDTEEDVEGARRAGIEPVLIKRQRPAGSAVILDYSADPARATDFTPAPDISRKVKTVARLSELLEPNRL